MGTEYRLELSQATDQRVIPPSIFYVLVEISFVPRQ